MTTNSASTATVSEAPIPSRYDDMRLYEGVRTKRILAFIADYLIVGLFLLIVGTLVFFLGLLTLGLGWMLFAILGPLVALTYVGMTMGGPSQSTLGMRMMGIRLERLDGRTVDPLLAIVHTVLFWAGNTVLTPLILIAPLFLEKKRTVHDLLLGTVVVRSYP